MLTEQGQRSGDASGIQSSGKSQLKPRLRVTYITAVTSRLTFLTQVYFSVRGIQFDYTMLTYHCALKPFHATQDTHTANSLLISPTYALVNRSILMLTH